MEFYLRWLPVHRRIKFKIALITYKTLTFWHLLKTPIQAMTFIHAVSAHS